MSLMKKRCAWVDPSNQLLVDYHDMEWGREVHDDRTLFECLTLEGAQAGLSWATVLSKRERYREVFDNFDIEKIIHYTDEKIASLFEEQGIISHRLKIMSVLKNAKVVKTIQKEYGSFDSYLWSFLQKGPVKNNFKDASCLPSQTPLSVHISKDLKKRGMSFVGPVIIYSFMQAIGMVCDHTRDCYLYEAE